MLDSLNSRVFSEQLHTTFRVRVPGPSILSLELSDVTEKNLAPQAEQFSLVFRDPATGHIPQGTYTFEHDKLGTFDLFLVPIGPDSGGMRYEVVFNRLKKRPPE
jgi:hypothetical protein